MEIIRDLFDGTVHYANTRKQDLINNGTLALSERLQCYLLALSSTLDVAQWLKEQNRAPNQRRYGPFSKAVVGRLRRELHGIVDSMNPKDSPSPSTDTVVKNEGDDVHRPPDVLRNAFLDGPADGINVQSM